MRNSNFPRIKLPEEVASAILEVDRRILGLDKASFRNAELYKPAMHLLYNRGKFMRPSLLLLGAYVTGNEVKRFTDLAVAAELLHTSSLIHDDIIDKDVSRRGVETVHVKYGNESAILAGDALISMAIGISSRYGEKAIGSISSAAMDMCAGEALDYRFQRERKVPNLDEYEKIAELKSASLIAACCNIVASCRKNRLAKRLYAFGRDLGVAFQMRDDILDYTGYKGGGAETFRPNLVVTIRAYSPLSESEAMEKAIGMQNRHIDDAIRELGKAEEVSLVAEYADSTRIR